MYIHNTYGGHRFMSIIVNNNITSSCYKSIIPQNRQNIPFLCGFTFGIP